MSITKYVNVKEMDKMNKMEMNGEMNEMDFYI